MASLPSFNNPRRALLATLAVLALVALMVLPALALARVARSASHSATCAAASHSASHHGKRSSGKSHCTKHKTHKAKKKTHKTKKTAGKKTVAPSIVLTPAVCEDGSLPSHAGGGTYTCEDGSEPACEDGDAPTRSKATSAPMCKSESEVEVEVECLQEASGECQAGEFACEDSRESGEAGQACEVASGEEVDDESED
jgi:type II secretory pathway pseudopilin PulG